MSGGLFQRMKARAFGGPELPQEQAILLHLSRLLNTRQGSSALDPLYGLPDITDLTHALPASIPTLQRMIVDAVQRGEPRIKSVSIRMSVSSHAPLSLSFQLRAQLVRGGDLSFQTRVSRGGQVSVI